MRTRHSTGGVRKQRARWIGLMIDKMTDLFMAREDELLKGTLEQDLLKCLPASNLRVACLEGKCLTSRRG